MVQILTADDTKVGPSKALLEQQAKVRALADEETRLVIRVNDLRIEEENERNRVDAATQKMRNTFAAERTELEVDIARLKKEREPLLCPIEELKKEVDARAATLDLRLRQAEDKEAHLVGREKDIAAAAEKNIEYLEVLTDRAADLDERELSVKKREAIVKSAEDINRQGTLRLGNEWDQYHDAVKAKSNELDKREAKVAAEEKANKIRAVALDEQEQRNIADRHGIEDTYRAIEQAKKHLGIKDLVAEEVK